MDTPLLILFIVIVAMLLVLIAWHRELTLAFGWTWLRLLIIRDTILRKSKWADISVTTRYREHRSLIAVLEMEDFFLSHGFARYVSRNKGRQGPHRTFLWKFGEDSYWIDLMRGEVTHSRKQYVVTSSIEQALDRFREVYPEYDPYWCFVFRLADARQILKDDIRGN